jgi:hypothetical protein
MAVRLSALRPGRPLPLGRYLVLISARGWVDPRATVRLEGLGQFKNPITSGFEPATIQLAAWSLNYATACSSILLRHIFLYAQLSSVQNQFLHTNSSVQLYISRHFGSTCFTSSSLDRNKQLPFSNPLLIPLNFQIPVFIQSNPIIWFPVRP